MAAAIWMGGLLGFAIALFSGPLDALAPDRQATLRERSVRRFSKVATTAVVVLASTGLYAILLHVPSLQALVATPFGRLVVAELLLALGLFIATGFLTSLPPASAA